MAELIHKASGFIVRHKVLTGIVFGVVLMTIFVIGGLHQRAALKQQEELNTTESSVVSEISTPEDLEGVSEDIALLQLQPSLVKAFGKLPEGYIWEENGTLLSLGDPSMTAEEVVYSFINGLRNLDISTAQKFSRNSMVVANYSSFFDSTEPVTDYADNFLRNMYRQALLSMQIEGIENTSVFAENKQVFSVNLNILDLSSKTFWEEDIKEIYQNLSIYSSLESDSTKAEIYLYDYVLNYYKQPDAARRSIRVDLTVEKYPDLNTGWLVSIDTDIDSFCRYTDGTLVISYINERFNDEGMDMIRAWAEEDKKEEDSSSNTSSVVVE